MSAPEGPADESGTQRVLRATSPKRPCALESQNETWNVERERDLLRFDVGCPDHLGPLLGFFRNKRPEIGRRASNDYAAQVGKLNPQFRIGEAGIDLLVEPIDNLDGCFPRRAEAEISA